ncbi:hypothetical protein BDP55DRAFT_633062 [Colletotrichum godetiae]|uniref:Secreted protein n=1 Tax=Colletotrichum godetiae TaxID=1209918 RepID=A0AAJ0AIP9_9PEZI|nr:uncharacterized protein BDP55DRAFT_633062 [Colletotrichum godetiae]KAK1674625.1 hypothetical protein BDP55DRAFT_633062 [Colletotrichum godetiae]
MSSCAALWLIPHLLACGVDPLRSPIKAPKTATSPRPKISAPCHTFLFPNPCSSNEDARTSPHSRRPGPRDAQYGMNRHCQPHLKPIPTPAPRMPQGDDVSFRARNLRTQTKTPEGDGNAFAFHVAISTGQLAAPNRSKGERFHRIGAEHLLHSCPFRAPNRGCLFPLSFSLPVLNSFPGALMHEISNLRGPSTPLNQRLDCPPSSTAFPPPYHLQPTSSEGQASTSRENSNGCAISGIRHGKGHRHSKAGGKKVDDIASTAPPK